MKKPTWKIGDFFICTNAAESVGPEPAPPADRPDTLEARLRRACECVLDDDASCLQCEAADTIAALRAELEAARKERDAAHAHACENSLEERGLRAELEALKQEHHDHEACIKDMEDAFNKTLEEALNRAEAAEAQVAALTAALKKYGQHAKRCVAHAGAFASDGLIHCDCGLEPTR